MKLYPIEVPALLRLHPQSLQGAGSPNCGCERTFWKILEVKPLSITKLLYLLFKLYPFSSLKRLFLGYIATRSNVNINTFLRDLQKVNVSLIFFSPQITIFIPIDSNILRSCFRSKFTVNIIKRIVVATFQEVRQSIGSNGKRLMVQITYVSVQKLFGCYPH